MKCVNENCKNDPMKSENPILVNCDGDFACSCECKIKYEKQRDDFFNNIGNDVWFNRWLDY